MGGGPANTLSLLELIALLQEITGRSVKVRFDKWRKFDQKIYVSDIAKAQRTLRWSPLLSPPGKGLAVLWRGLMRMPLCSGEPDDSAEKAGVFG